MVLATTSLPSIVSSEIDLPVSIFPSWSIKAIIPLLSCLMLLFVISRLLLVESDDNMSRIFKRSFNVMLAVIDFHISKYNAYRRLVSSFPYILKK